MLVVGAGPAGLTAARALAADGFSVLVLEEHLTIGEPVHCTGVIGLDAFDELDLPRDTIRTTVSTARFHGRNGRHVSMDGGQAAAAIVDRGRFDRALAGKAQKAGAVLATGARVRSLAVGDHAVTATVDAQGGTTRVEARLCLLACGAQYRFNRQLGLGLPGAWLQTAQVETPFAPVDRVEVDLNHALAPGGFGWVVPFVRDDAPMARIGVMARSGAAARFSDYLSLLQARHGCALAAVRPRIKLLPLAPVKRTFGDRLLVLGDAAGLAKPTTGGGIYYGVLSGGYAAEIAAPALRRDALGAASLRAYETRWRARLGSELRAGMAFRTIAARFDDRAIDALLELAIVDGIVPLLRRTADFNWHRQAALALLRNAGFRRIVLSSLWTGPAPAVRP